MSYPKIKRLQNLSGYLFHLTNQGQLFEMNNHEKVDWDNKVQDLTGKIKELEKEIAKINSTKVHRRRRPTEAQRILFIPQNLVPNRKRY